MLHIFRESIGRYVTIAILALIAITFVFFGIDFTTTQSSFAARVNGEPIPIQEFERELQLTQNQYQQANRVELTDDLRLAIRQSVLDSMVMREAMLQRASEAGYRVANERLIEDIRSVAAFQVNGRFSQDIYRSRLAAEGYTPSMFEEAQREQATLNELQTALTDSSFVTPAEFRRRIELLYERREIAWALFAEADFRDQVEISDEAVTSYYEENGDRFMAEEAVDIEYVELSLDDVAESIEISDEELRRIYEAEVERFAAGEERRVSHILIEVAGDDTAEAAAEAEAVRERLEAGEDFAGLAAEVSDDAGTSDSGGDLGWIARGVLPAPFEEVLFALEPGEIGGPVETEFGIHVLRLEEIRAGDRPPFEAMRDELRSDIASDRAYADFLDRANDLERAAFEAGADLASVARDFDLPLLTVERLTATNAGEHFADPAPVLDQAFDEDLITSGFASPLIDLGGERVAVLRVSGHYLPEPEPLEAVREEIREILTADAATELAAEAAAAFMAELDPAAVAAGSEDPAELAAMHGGSFNPPVWVERSSTSVPAGILGPVFSATRPAEGEIEVLRAPVAEGEAVVLLSTVAPGVPDDIPSADREAGQQQIRGELAEAELNAYAADTRARATVRVPDQVLNPDL